MNNDNWHKHNMHNINNTRVSLLNRLKCDRPGIARSYNILVMTELIITTLFDRVLIVRHPKLLRVSMLT
jgi:hypothetical protein